MRQFDLHEPVKGDRLSAAWASLLVRAANHQHSSTGPFVDNDAGFLAFVPPGGAARGVGYPFLNNSGETVPAYGCMAVAGIAIDGVGDPIYDSDGNVTLNCVKPSTTFRRLYVLNMDTAIAHGQTGRCFTPGGYDAALFLYNTGEPALSETFGPTSGQWYLTKTYPGIIECIGNVDSTAKIGMGYLHPLDGLIPFELYDDVTPGASDKYVWLLKNSAGTLVRDTDTSKVYVSDGILGDVRAYGSSHSGFTTGAKGFFTPGANGKNQIVSIQRLAKLCTCQLTAAQTGADASFNVDTVVPMDGGQSPVTGSSDTLATYNVRACAGADNAPTLIAWNETTDQWEVVYIKNTSQAVVTTWRYDSSTHKFQVKTRTGWCNWAGTESDWTDAPANQPVSQSVVTDVEDATTYLTHDKKTTYLLEAGSESTDNIVALDDCP